MNSVGDQIVHESGGIEPARLTFRQALMLAYAMSGCPAAEMQKEVSQVISVEDARLEKRQAIPFKLHGVSDAQV